VENQHIENIISKKLIEGLDSQEQLILDSWLNESESNRKKFDAYTKLWEKSNTLVLSDKIDIETSLLLTKKKINFKSDKKWLVFIRQAAAVLILSFLLSYFFNYNKKETYVQEVQEKEVIQEVTASYGTHTKLTLADGTRVWLNSGSTVKFPTSFKNHLRREVILDGEGYFEVEKDSIKPFIVKTSKLDVKVYGTAFNVMSYDSQGKMTVALTEGKVSLLKNGSLKDEELAVMQPNEVVTYKPHNQKLNQMKDNYIEKYSAWKDGQIIFYGDPIDVVVRRLEKWYNVDINVADKELRQYRFTATFIDESLEQVLKLLSLSSEMDYEITPSQKLQDNTFSQRKITLKSKIKSNN